MALCSVQAGADIEIELVIHYQMLASKRKTEAVKVAILPEVQCSIQPGLQVHVLLPTCSSAPACAASIHVFYVKPVFLQWHIFCTAAGLPWDHVDQSLDMFAAAACAES